MSYFSKFNIVEYDSLKLRNIANRVGFTKEVLGTLEVFQDIVLRDGQTPEMIASDWYYDSEHLWLVLMTNNIIDPVYDWLMSPNQLNRYINSKYDDPNAIAFYVNSGIRYNSNTIVPSVIVNDILTNLITFAQWEDEINEAKRNIRVIRPRYLNQIIEEFRTKIT